jgi:hypothetical protein
MCTHEADGTRAGRKSSRLLFRLGAETGAFAPLVAGLIVLLVTGSLWGANAAALYGVSREASRAADLAALAGAANIPFVGLLSSGEPQTTSCTYAQGLLSDESGPLTNNLSTTGAVPACSAGTVTVEPEGDFALLDSLIAQHRVALEGLRDQVLALLGTTLEDLCSPLPLVGGLNPLLLALGYTDTDCESLQGALANLPDNLSPATVAPRVRVTVTGTYDPPVPFPGFGGDRPIGAVATAKRRYKALIVLPAVAVNGAPQPLDSTNLNPQARQVRDVLIPALWDANEALRQALAPVAPSFDLAPLIEDVEDLYDPPGAAQPDPVLIANAAALEGEPVVVLRLFELPILGIPALDFTAAYLTPLGNCDPLGDCRFEATPIPVEQLTGASGLFGARLVTNRPAEEA